MSTTQRGARSRRPLPPPNWLSRRLGPFPAWGLGLAALALAAVVAVAAINSLSGAANQPVAYDVGAPGVGQAAPDFELPSATGGSYRLSAQRGRDVLLYFHEGLGCAPCWQQVFDIQKDLERFTAVGVDQVVAISIDPLAAQAEHAQLNGVTLPVLADTDRSVSRAYDALSYGMMGGATPGHTFILVGPDGMIRWRADYGGPPKFTMYVANDTLLSELRRVIGG